ncbi:MAG: fumarate hydratase [Armatimonadetes bacterium RBG_16_58_9]|nr:MAG: fumarate hydratase [Armatimonadetes bacterium RBG_16_58_9]
MKAIKTPLTDTQIESLHAGDSVLLSGVVYTARDAAHARLVALLRGRKPLPVDLAGQVIYYVGPTPAKPGRIIGSAGPTTAGRMDSFVPELLDAGLKGMIGKGLRDQTVIDAIKTHKAVYFAATGGAAAMLAKHITSCEVIAYEELECEAIHRLEVVDLPLVVIDDAYGCDFYRENQAKYARI